MRKINDTIYIDELGQLYKPDNGIIATEEDIPDFNVDIIGQLKYKDKKENDTNYLVSEDGDLLSESDNMFIDDSGRLSVEIKWNLIKDTDDETLQKNINLLRSHNKKVQMKVILYNEQYIEIDSIEGKIKSCDFEKTLSSDIRNTCTLVLSLSSKEQINLDFERTWNRRMVELYCGLYYAPDDIYPKDGYVWYSLGRMLMTGGSTRYDATTQEVKLNLVDLMASLTQDRGSQIGTPIFIPAGSRTDEVIKGYIAKMAEFNRYNICTFDEADETIPYDLEIDIGTYPIDVLSEILNLFPKYEMFYDVDGVFVVQKKPTKINDPINIDYNIIDNMLISESKSIDFSEVKNTTEIWGRELSGDYVAKSCTSSGDTYNVTIDETFTELVNGDTYTIVPPTTSIVGQKMKIQELPAYSIYTATGVGVYTKLTAGAMIAGVPYVIKYFEGSLGDSEGEEDEESGKMFVLQGELQVRCIVQEINEEPSISAMIAYKEDNACNNVAWIVNPDSPFACWLDPSTHRIEGEIKQVLSGGEYDGIYTTNLAYERAKYENWLRCRLQDTIEVEMVLIPWMELNQKIRFTSPVTEELGTWIVQGINYDFKRWTMTVKASRFYPSDPWEEYIDDNETVDD